MKQNNHSSVFRHIHRHIQRLNCANSSAVSYCVFYTRQSTAQQPYPSIIIRNFARHFFHLDVLVRYLERGYDIRVRTSLCYSQYSPVTYSLQCRQGHLPYSAPASNLSKSHSSLSFPGLQHSPLLSFPLSFLIPFTPQNPFTDLGNAVSSRPPMHFYAFWALKTHLISRQCE